MDRPVCSVCGCSLDDGEYITCRECKKKAAAKEAQLPKKEGLKLVDREETFAWSY